MDTETCLDQSGDTELKVPWVQGSEVHRVSRSRQARQEVRPRRRWIQKIHYHSDVRRTSQLHLLDLRCHKMAGRTLSLNRKSGTTDTVTAIPLKLVSIENRESRSRSPRSIKLHSESPQDLILHILIFGSEEKVYVLASIGLVYREGNDYCPRDQFQRMSLRLSHLLYQHYT